MSYIILLAKYSTLLHSCTVCFLDEVSVKVILAVPEKQVVKRYSCPHFPETFKKKLRRNPGDPSCILMTCQVYCTSWKNQSDSLHSVLIFKVQLNEHFGECI